jgi:hypothetical protein
VRRLPAPERNLEAGALVWCLVVMESESACRFLECWSHSGQRFKCDGIDIFHPSELRLHMKLHNCFEFSSTEYTALCTVLPKKSSFPFGLVTLSVRGKPERAVRLIQSTRLLSRYTHTQLHHSSQPPCSQYPSYSRMTSKE